MNTDSFISRQGSYVPPAGQIVTWYGKLHWEALDRQGSYLPRSACGRALGYNIAPHYYVTAEKVAKRGFCKFCERIRKP